ILLASLMRRQGRVPVTAFAPMAGVLCLTAAGMLYFNWRITGNALLRPYDANRAQYAVANLMVWQQPKPVPKNRHEVMRDFYVNWETIGFNLSRGWKGWEAGLYEKIFRTWLFYFSPLFTIPLVPIRRVVKDKRIRPLILIAAVAMVILSVSIYFSPHY